MAQANLDTAAAATKIQATVRGKQDRKRTEAHITNVIEAMMAGEEPPPFSTAPQPKSLQENSAPKSTFKSSLYTSGDDCSDADEASVEEEVIVVLDDSYTDHTREELLAEFVTYTEEPPEKPLPSPPRKKSAFEAYNDQLKGSLNKPKKAPYEKPPTTSIEEEPGNKEDPPIELGWRGKLKKKLSWKSSKAKPADIAAPQQAEASIEDKPKPSKVSTIESKPAAMPEDSSLKNKIDLDEPKLDGSELAPETTEGHALDDDSAMPSVERSKVKKRRSVVLPEWPPQAPQDLDKPVPKEEQKVIRSPVVLPKWLAKKELPPAPTLESSTENAEEEQKITRSPVVLPKWLAKKELPPAPNLESTIENTHTSEEAPQLVHHSSHHKDKIATPWLKKKPETSEQESSERGSSPPPPTRLRSPHAARSKLVSRYLSNVSKDDPTERERILAQIEADRARGRWDGKCYVGGNEVGDESKQRKNWKYLQPKEKVLPEEPFDEGAAIKLQALVRGFVARRRVAKYVDSLIEDMMRKLNAAQAENREIEHRERRLKDEEEFRRWQEREEERRRNEDEEIRQKMHDQRYGLPLWWMETIPHNTMDEEEYEANVKEDNGATVVDYKIAPRNTQNLDVVKEEETEIDDENDSNLDKIIGNSTGAEVVNTTSKRKKKKNSIFSCMDVDGVEEVKTFSGNGYENTPASNVALNTNKKDDDNVDDDKEDTESEAEPQQELVPPEVTKIWM